MTGTSPEREPATPTEAHSGEPAPGGRRGGGVLARLLAIGLFAVAMIAALLLALVEKPHLLLDPERRVLEVTRARHLALSVAGRPLPGTPDLARLDQRLAEHGVKLGDPVLIRIFKREHELEVWLARDGRFQRFATYPICRWSGALGPKLRTGDRQAPEGFYAVSAAQLNPNSRWYRSFNLGFPNAFDQSFGRTGSALMVHGGCSSAGCFAMTNAVIDEIWRLVTAALGAGQKRFQVQAFPFRMSDEAVAAKDGHPDAPFWRNLKQGHDLFDATLLPPTVTVCRGRYRFEQGAETAVRLTAPVERRCSPHDSVAGVGRKARKSL